MNRPPRHRSPGLKARSRVAAHACPMVVQPDPQPDPASPTINLLAQGPGGLWAVRVPVAAFPMADLDPGSVMTVGIMIQQTHIEPGRRPPAPKIILPGENFDA